MAIIGESDFPDAIDQFIIYEDIQERDLSDIRRYQELRVKDNKSSAEIAELGELNERHRGKIPLAQDFNKFSNALVQMQIFMKQHVEVYLLGKQEEWEDYIEEKKSEVTSEIDQIAEGRLRADIGNMKALTTQARDNLVESVNELKGNQDTHTSEIEEVDNKTDQLTDAIDSMGELLSSVLSRVDTIDTRLSTLETKHEGLKSVRYPVPRIQNGWAFYTTGRSVRISMDGLGNVHILGAVKNGILGEVAFSLPRELWPRQNVYQSNPSSGGNSQTARILMTSAGNLTPQSVSGKNGTRWIPINITYNINT